MKDFFEEERRIAKLERAASAIAMILEATGEDIQRVTVQDDRGGTGNWRVEVIPDTSYYQFYVAQGDFSGELI